MFFTNQTMPYVSTANQSCIVTYSPAPACYPANVTDDPSMNLSSSGVLGMAYTAFTNQTPCGQNPSAQSEIAFTASTDGGSTWSSPLYLGNTACDAANASAFPSAWMPSLTSLANGTFVLVYLEFNFTNVTFPTVGQPPILPNMVFGVPGYTNVAHDRLVITESYDGGADWTDPVVLNSSSDPVRPWVTATGQTIYVVWANETESVWGNFFCPPVCSYPYSPLAIYGSAQVHLLVSTDGGGTWGATRDLPVRVSGSNPYWAMNPVDVVLPDGDLIVAYDTNLSGNSSMLSQWYVGDIVVARSTDNGTSFNLSTLLSGAHLDYGGRYNWVFWNHILTLPELAVGPQSRQLYSTFTVRTSFGDEEVYLANASTAGTGTLRWATHLVYSFADVGNSSTAQWESSPFYTERYNAVVSVGASGVVEIAATIQNDSETSAAPTQDLGAQFFGGWSEYYTQSADNGSSFTPALRINTFEAWWPPFQAGPYEGEYGASLVFGGGLEVAWNRVYCPQWNTSLLTDCGFSFTTPPFLGDSQNVVLSRLFPDTGLQVSFTESGLPNGTVWSVTMEGNVRVGVAPATLSFSGVPPFENLTWTAGDISTGYGTRYASTAYSYAAPDSFASNTSIQVQFERQYLVNISTSPLISDSYLEYAYGFLAWDLAFRQIETCYLGFSLPGYFLWDNPFCNQLNYNTTPEPGLHWVDAGSTLNLSATSIPFPYCVGFCASYYLANLTFLAWSGLGAGSVNTSSANGTITVDGPINETADYAYDGWCYFDVYGSPPWSCFGSNATVVFEEHGLPNGTLWSVTSWTLGGNASSVITNSSNSTVLLAPAPVGGAPLGYAVWAIPSTSGAEWTATTTPSGPIGLPFGGPVEVNFSLSSAPPATTTVVAVANGLPNATAAWTLDVDGAGLGVSGPQGILSLSPGDHSLNVSPIYLPNGTAYLPVSLSFASFTANTSWVNGTQLPVLANLTEGGEVVVTFALAYRIAVTGASGGTVDSSVTWVVIGGSATLSATPLSGYAFLDWTGTGPGSVSGTSPTITVFPLGPVEELATFSPVSPLLYDLTARASGLPSSQAFTVEFNGSNYTGVGSIQLPAVPQGTYSFVPSIARSNSSSLVQFLPTGWKDSNGQNTGPSINLSANGTIVISYETEYALSVSASGPGAVTPTGTSWEIAQSRVLLNATPAGSAVFLEWNGSGSGAYSGPNVSASIRMSGPITEVAQFVNPSIASASGFSVDVIESGLPAGAQWNVTAGGHGATGSSSNLTVSGVEGVVTIVIGIVSQGVSGVRYDPFPSSIQLNVTHSDTPLAVSFELEYQVKVLAGGGGTVNTSGGWYAPGALFEAVASPLNGSFSFTGWSGSVYNGTSPRLSFVVQESVTESATFAPSAGTGGGMAPSLEAWTEGTLAFLGVAAVSAVAGVILTRGRSRPPIDDATVSNTANSAPEEKDRSVE